MYRLEVLSMKYTNYITGLLITLLLCGCSAQGDTAPTPDSKTELWESIESAENIETPENATEDTTETAPAPSKDEVLSMRETVLEGMSTEEIERLTENIKVANLQMERAYLYDNIFGKLENKDNLYWNYFDAKGDIQIGTEKDGTPIMAYNRFDAANFIALMTEMQESVQNEGLKTDLQSIIDETALAAETHEVEHANNIYKLLHDMDYFLLRYGIEDVGKYTNDASVVATYYGVLSVYDSSTP